MAKTTIIFIALFIISSTVGVVNHISYRSSLKSWKQAVANRDQKLNECQQQVASKPTPEPTPQPKPTRMPDIENDSNPVTQPSQEKEVADVSGYLDVLAQLDAATQSGVNYVTYSAIVTNLMLEKNKLQGKISTKKVAILITETLWCHQAAKDLWGAALEESAKDCGTVTSMVQQKYPQFTVFKDNATNLDAQIQYKKTLQFLWDIASERQRELIVAVQ